MLRPLAVILSAVVLSVAALSSAAAAPAPAGLTAAAALERLVSLSGSWEGTIEGEGGGTARVTYRVISGGRAVLETLFPGTEHEMLSIYLVDGENLRMTHYCAMGNQPRMRLDRAASTPQDLRFVFEGGTNLDPAKDAHIHEGRMTFAADGTMRAVWGYNKDGRPAGQHAFKVARVPATAAATATAPPVSH
jgi:hypothetical protein